MEIRLDRIRDEPFTWEETLDVPARSLGPSELVGLSPIVCRGRVAPVEEDFYLEVRLDYRQRIDCTRCLATFEEPVEVDLELLLVVERDAAAGRRPGPRSADDAEDGEVELSEEELGMLVLPEERLDSRPLVEEQIELQVPMKPLCRPDCEGLCPRCGARRATESCDCETGEADPRWAALAGLRGQLPSDPGES